MGKTIHKLCNTGIEAFHLGEAKCLTVGFEESRLHSYCMHKRDNRNCRLCFFALRLGGAAAECRRAQVTPRGIESVPEMFFKKK